MSEHDSATGQFTEPKFGREGVEADQGFLLRVGELFSGVRWEHVGSRWLSAPIAAARA